MSQLSLTHLEDDGLSGNGVCFKKGSDDPASTGEQYLEGRDYDLQLFSRIRQLGFEPENKPFSVSDLPYTQWKQHVVFWLAWSEWI
jgi:hypothetical protein